MQNMVKIGLKISGTLHKDQNVFHVVSNNLFSATIKQTHYCASITMLLILHCWQRYMYVNNTN